MELETSPLNLKAYLEKDKKDGITITLIRTLRAQTKGNRSVLYLTKTQKMRKIMTKKSSKAKKIINGK